MEQMKEKFAKLLLGEDMSGGGKGVSSALALSNAITNLAGIFHIPDFPILIGYCISKHTASIEICFTELLSDESVPNSFIVVLLISLERMLIHCLVRQGFLLLLE